jgi:protein-S-isoprenylcysteine O-methyltransferase Ste14
MGPLVFHQPLAEILFWTNLALWLAIEQWLGLRAGTGPVRNAQDWTYLFIVMTILGSIACSILLASNRVAPLPGPTWWPVVAGLTMLWAGIAFRVWAVFTLGSFFKSVVVTQEDHRVVEIGPYRWLRHPSYTGMLATTLGLGLAEGDWASAALMLAGPLIGLLVRIQVEERFLLKALGAEYADYARRTARLVPRVF